MLRTHTLNRLYLLIILIPPTLIFSSSLTIHGKVVDTNQNPIHKVNIYTTNVGTESSEDGSFLLMIDKNSIVTISHIGFNSISFLAEDVPHPIVLHSTFLNGKEVIVNGGLDSQSLRNTASSISLIAKNELRRKSENHFQGLIDNIPNLNYASGTSRPRYFQIRGIGERSQYVGEGAPNFSVGFMVDGIDFSGIGMTAMLFDTEQIEVFKGPQSAIYGPNAMAGLINITTAEPTFFETGHTLFSIGSDNMKTGGFAIGAPLNDNVAFRLAFQCHTQDGFRKNVYRNIYNSNKRDENFLRTKLNWLVSKDFNIQYIHFNANLNNGYDAWAVDNNEDFITYSDEQGMDSQRSIVNSIKFNVTNIFNADLHYQFTSSTNKMEHSYDGDWANNDYWLLEPYNFDPNVTWWEYSFYDETIRNRDVFSHTFRVSFDFNSNLFITTGVNYTNTKENDIAEGWLFGGDATSVNSEFKIYNSSVYTQVKYKLLEKLQFVANVRSERVRTEYSSNGENWGAPTSPVQENIKHSFSGGKFSVSYDLMTSTNLFANFSKGYKAGGINQNPNLSEIGRFYDPETNNNYEVGFKFNSDFATANVTLFSMNRQNQQVQVSSQQEEGNPNTFVYFTSNATSGTNSGLEFDSKIKIINGLSFNSSIGLLNTHINPYEFWEDSSTVIRLGDREQAMAPRYNFSLGLNYTLSSGIFANIEYVGKDEYYFSDSHDEKSEAYELLNFSTGITKDNWTLSFWGKNITDVRYATRGFYFGNEPIWNAEEDYHEYPDKLYISYGDPLQYGITLKYQF